MDTSIAYNKPVSSYEENCAYERKETISAIQN